MRCRRFRRSLNHAAGAVKPSAPEMAAAGGPTHHQPKLISSCRAVGRPVYPFPRVVSVLSLPSVARFALSTTTTTTTTTSPPLHSFSGLSFKTSFLQRATNESPGTERQQHENRSARLRRHLRVCRGIFLP